MRADSPLVLTALIDASEHRSLGRVLGADGLRARPVVRAEDADVEIARHPGRCVLVVDSGLLQMHHSAEWRKLRERRPQLGTVIRCLIHASPEQKEPGTFLVHPDHDAGLLEAVRSLAASPL